MERESVRTPKGNLKAQTQGFSFVRVNISMSMRSLTPHSSLLGPSVPPSSPIHVLRSSKTATIQGFACFEMFGSSLQKASASSWFANRHFGEKGGGCRSLYADAPRSWESGTPGAQLQAAAVILSGKKRQAVLWSMTCTSSPLASMGGWK